VVVVDGMVEEEKQEHCIHDDVLGADH